MKKFALRGMIILAVVVALCIFFSGTVRTLTTPKVRFAPAKNGKFEQSTNLTGKVVFPEEEEILIPIPEGMSLTVTRVRVAVGDRVKTGDTLAVAKVTDADKTLAALEKDFETAQTSLRSLEKKRGEIRLSNSEQKWQEAWQAEQTAMRAERDTRVNLQVLLSQGGQTLEKNGTLPENADEDTRKVYAAWKATETVWKAKQAELKAMDRYAIEEELWADMQKMEEYRKTMAESEQKITELEILKKKAENLTAPHDGYISEVKIEKGSSLDGEMTLVKMTPADRDPVIRVELGSMKQTVEKGTAMEVESDAWGRTETEVVNTGISLEGHPYADCAINRDVRYALGSVAEMMKLSEIKLILFTRAKETTCIVPASAVRGSGNDRYVYVTERENSTFGGSRLKCKKMSVTVLGESGGNVSLSEDLSYEQVIYMEDRSISDGATVMTYE